MIVLIDDGNIEEIKKIYDKYPVDGVTTNPTILSRQGRPPMDVLREIKAFIPKGHQLHAQVISQKAEDMVKEAQHMVDILGDDMFIKVPCTDEGIKAMMAMHAIGIKITATACYSPNQALMAAKAGAAWVAPYVNRLDNMGADGISIAQDIHDIFTLHGLDCGVVAASFKNAGQILSLARYGIPSVTASPDVLEAMIHHPASEKAVEDFTDDFHRLCGDGQTMLTQE